RQRGPTLAAQARSGLSGGGLRARSWRRPACISARTAIGGSPASRSSTSDRRHPSAGRRHPSAGSLLQHRPHVGRVQLAHVVLLGAPVAARQRHQNAAAGAGAACDVGGVRRRMVRVQVAQDHRVGAGREVLEAEALHAVRLSAVLIGENPDAGPLRGDIVGGAGSLLQHLEAQPLADEDCNASSARAAAGAPAALSVAPDCVEPRQARIPSLGGDALCVELQEVQATGGARARTAGCGSRRRGPPLRLGGKMEKFTTESIKEYSKKDSKRKLIVIHGKVYDVTTFMHRHPGGAKLLGSYSGEDATDAFVALHNDKALVEKYMKPLECGVVVDYEDNLRDFRELRKVAETSGWFATKPFFFFKYLVQCWLFELAAVFILWHWGVNLLTFVAAALLLCTAQAQAGWAQHDYGHLSVFNSRRLNHIGHELVVGHLKGASSHWWNFRHFLHHSKPNVVGTDPDIGVPYVFLLGDKMPKEWGQKKRGFMPYNWQHDYFWLLGPPMLLPLYFHFENVYFTLKRRNLRDLMWTVSFFAKFFYVFNHFFSSWWGTFALYMFTRYLESHWFVACTQMSHIPMDIDRDQRRDWFSMQLKATMNAEGGSFNDWFTGHLNYQIEHHLFPTMPRHSYPLVQPHVKRICSKHGIPYVEKPLGTAFADIIRSLKKSGELWFEAYYMPG
uniref:Cytochrome b5 heme-binding domain-containing protein n=3 Tax=Macrostomum lignano TaxID=282301 RepID=A0A1I8G128_9PLAT